MTEPLTPPAELSRLTGIPEGTLAQWRYLGKGPAYVKLGKRVGYRSEDIDHWIKENRVEGVSRNGVT